MTSRFAGLPPVAGVRAAGGAPADAGVSLRMADGGEASFPLRRVQGRQVVAAVPWRKTRSARGQAHYPGYFWSATTGGHVIYESRLELARLLLADFDRDVTAIAAQPWCTPPRICFRWIRFSARLTGSGGQVPSGPCARGRIWPFAGGSVVLVGGTELTWCTRCMRALTWRAEDGNPMIKGHAVRAP